MLDPRLVNIHRITAILLLLDAIETDPRTEGERWSDAMWFGRVRKRPKSGRMNE